MNANQPSNAGSSAAKSGLPPRSFGWGLVAALLAAVAVIGVTGFFYLQTVTTAAHKVATDNLTAVAESKVREIVNWRAERLSDGNVLMENPFLAEAVARWLANPDVANAEPLLVRFRSLQTHYHYRDVLLVDASGQVRLSLSDRRDRVHEEAATALAAALRDRSVVLTDLHAGPGDLPPHMDVVVPIAATASRSAIILQVDAGKFLYPLIQKWPTASPSAETLLIRQEGNDVLYLNELRHRKGTALALRLPIVDHNLPAARAVHGETGEMAGVDYRGVPVLSHVRAVPGTKWFMVAKVDQAEINAPLRQQALLISVSVGLLLLATGLGFWLFWRQQRVREIREKAEAVLVSEVRYRRLFEAARDGVLILDAETGLVVDVNPYLIELLGVTREVFLGKKVWELGFFKDAVANEANFTELKEKKYIRCEDMALEGHDGKRHEVEFVSNVYLADGLKVIQCNIRDISDRKRAEVALRKREEDYQMLFREMLNGFALHEIICDEVGNPSDYRFLAVNPAFERMTGLKAAETVGRTVSEILPDTERSWIEHYGKVALTGVPVCFENYAASMKKHFEVVAFRPTINQFACVFSDITERKQAEETLQAEKANLDAIFESSPVALFILDETTNIVRVNTAAVVLTGGSEAAALQHRPGNALRCVHASKDPRGCGYGPECPLCPARNGIESLLANGGEIHGAELMLELMRNGSPQQVWMAIGAEPVQLDGRRHLCVAMEDITARKQAAAINTARLHLIEFTAAHSLDELLEETLNEAEKLSGSVIGFYHFVEDDQVTLTLQNWSTRTKAEFCRAEGKGAHYAIDKAGVWVDCVHQRKPVIHNDYAALPHRKGMPEGHAVVIRQLVVPVMQGGKVMAILGVGNKPGDYTAADVEVISQLADLAWQIAVRKRAEEKLQASESQYRELFESSADALFVIASETGRIMDANPMATVLYGYEREELLAKKSTDLSAEPEETSRRTREAQSKPGQVFNIPLRLHRKKNGSVFPVEITARSLVRAGQSVLLIDCRDITDRKRAEQALQESALELQHKNAELERFLYTASHDLKSPVVTVRTFLGYLEHDMATGDADRITNDLNFIRTATDKMAQLLEDVLEMSRVGRLVGVSVTVTFRALVDDALGAVAGRIAERGVTMQVNDGDAALHGDRARLAEVFQNLIDNACKFMGDQQTPRIEVGVETRETETVFFVRDNGIGIEKRHQAKVFELFEKLDPKVEGTGIGLALVKRIVELYAGRIWVESPGLGQGACFYFTLPGAIALQTAVGKGDPAGRPRGDVTVDEPAARPHHAEFPVVTGGAPAPQAAVGRVGPPGRPSVGDSARPAVAPYHTEFPVVTGGAPAVQTKGETP